MGFFTRMLGAVVALGVLATTPAPAVAQDSQFYYCHLAEFRTTGGKNGGPRYVFYLSNIFRAPAVENAVMRQKFRRHVENTYPHFEKFEEVRCGTADNETEINRLRKLYTDGKKYLKEEYIDVSFRG